jgi:energy-converting hydrogenase A subunit M
MRRSCFGIRYTSNTSHKHLKLCYLYGFVSPLGMSLSKEITNAYCLTTNLLLSNTNHKHLKVCCLYDFVSPFGMSQT